MGLFKKLGSFAGRAARAVAPGLAVAHGLGKGGNVLKNVGGSLLASQGDAAMGAGALGAGYMAAPAIGGAASSAAGAMGGGGGAMGALGGGMRKLGGMGMENMIDLGLGAGSLYQGYKADKKASAADKRAQMLQDRAIAMAEQRYAERAPMRKLGMDMALNQTPEDVSGLYASANPFARRQR